LTVDKVFSADILTSPSEQSTSKGGSFKPPMFGKLDLVRIGILLQFPYKEATKEGSLLSWIAHRDVI
jgi:hypothetical protein